MPERGFSLNKNLLEGRNSLKEETIEALRIVQEHVAQYKSISEFPLPRMLLENVRNARKMYNEYLEAEKENKLKKTKELKSNDIDGNQQKNLLAQAQSSADIRAKIVDLEKRIKINSSLIEEGNKSLEKALKLKKVNY